MVLNDNPNKGNAMPDTTYLNKSPNYLKWIKSLYKEDLHTFSGIELEAMIRELVGEELGMDPEKVHPFYLNRECLIKQISSFSSQN